MNRLNPPASLLQYVNNPNLLLLKHLIFCPCLTCIYVTEDNNYFHVSVEMMADIKKVLLVNVLYDDVLVRSDWREINDKNES